MSGLVPPINGGLHCGGEVDYRDSVIMGYPRRSQYGDLGGIGAGPAINGGPKCGYVVCGYTARMTCRLVATRPVDQRSTSLRLVP